MWSSNTSKAGIALFVGAVQFVILLVVAESLYPGYSVSANFLSDLGATCTPPPPATITSCTIVQPASTVFTATLILLGAMFLVSARYLFLVLHNRFGTVAIALAGLGIVGAGIFPENYGIVHTIFSLLSFVSIGIGEIKIAHALRGAMRYFSVILGAATLIFLALGISGIDFGLGPGAMERMVAYPALLWAVGFGAQLMGTENLGP